MLSKTRMKISRILVAALFMCLACAVPLGAFAAGAEFDFSAFVGFYGQDGIVSVSLVNPGKYNGKKLIVRGEDGGEIASMKITGMAKQRRIPVKVEESMPMGQTISLWIEGENEPRDTAYFAVDKSPHLGISYVQCEEKLMAFTFDIASSNARVETVLNTLDKYDVKCTFFAQGRFVENYPESAREIAARGHEIASHAMTHPDMRTISNTDVYSNLTRAVDVIQEVTGTPPTLYRPPSGYTTPRDRAISRALGCEVIMWTIDSKDGFDDSTLASIVKRVKKNARQGDILLFHTYGKYTCGALDELLPFYIGQGYRFVTVSELMRSGTPYEGLIGERGE